MNPDTIKLAKAFVVKRAEFGNKLGSDKTIETVFMLGIHECAVDPTVENYSVTLMLADEILRRTGETSNTTEVPITYSN